MPNKFLSHSLVRASALVAGLALIAGCGSEASKSAASSSTAVAPSSTSASTTVAPTTAPATTVPATTVPAPTTTVAPEPLVLREDGLGPFDFGAAPTAVIDAITAQLGAPARNDILLYEDLSEMSEHAYVSRVGPYYYALAYPVGQTVCWAGEFCAEFGASSEADLSLIGWSYTGTPHLFASSSNLTIGAKWGDFPSMEVFPSCYDDGFGTHHGISLGLSVSGGWDWLVVDVGTGNYVYNLPDPEATRVDFMSAGEIPYQEAGDC